MTDSYVVSNTAELNQAIASIDATTAPGTETISFAANITLDAALETIDLASGVSLAIGGAGYGLDGAGTYQGFVVAQGTATPADLTIGDAVAAGAPGEAGSGGGGSRGAYGHYAGQPGSAFGSGTFFQGDHTLVLNGSGPAVAPLMIADDIADEAGSGGTGNNARQVSVLVEGIGDALLAGNDTFTGGVTIAGGTLVLGNDMAAGSGSIAFAGAGTLALAPNVDPANLVAGYAVGDTLDLLKTHMNGGNLARGTHTLTENGITAATLALAGDPSRFMLLAASDGHGGTDLSVKPHPSISQAPANDGPALLFRQYVAGSGAVGASDSEAPLAQPPAMPAVPVLFGPQN